MKNKIISVHSFRRSVGKSSLLSSLAARYVLAGKRVGLLDTDYQGASAHLFFGMAEDEITPTFNDYIWGTCGALATIHELTRTLGESVPGQFFLSSASPRTADVIKMLRTNISMDRYAEAVERISSELQLDLLFIDTPAGLNENTLMTLALASEIILVSRPDKQDLQGTAVIVDVAHELKVPNIHLVINDVSDNLETVALTTQLEQTYQVGDISIFPHSEELLALGSSKPFVISYPDHSFVKRLDEFSRLLE